MTASKMTKEGKTVADILTAAADLIEPAGAWTKHDWVGQVAWSDRSKIASPCFCVEGAIAHVMDVHPGNVQGTPAAAVLAEVVGGPAWAIPRWNDVPERTQAEVVAALRAAAEKALTTPEATA